MCALAVDVVGWPIGWLTLVCSATKEHHDPDVKRARKEDKKASQQLPAGRQAIANGYVVSLLICAASHAGSQAGKRRDVKQRTGKLKWEDAIVTTTTMRMSCR